MPIGVCLLAASCGSQVTPLTDQDELAVYAAAIHEAKQLLITMPATCTEPLNVFVAVEEADPPTTWLRSVSDSCYEFLPGSTYKADAGVLVRFSSIRWNGSEATVDQTNSYVGGGANASTVVTVATSTGPATLRAPRMAASRGGTPCSRRA